MKKKIVYVILDFIKTIKQDDISAWAAKLTFYILLSIFPFMIFVIEILSQIAFENTEIIYELTNFFPPEIMSIFKYIVDDIANSNTPTSILPIAIIATIWAASKGIMAIIGGLNMAYKEKETRSYFYLRGLSLIYTIAFAFILIITLSLIVFGNKLIQLTFTYLPILVNLEGTFDILRFLLSLIILFLFFILLYNATPNRKISFKDVMPGSIFATISLITLSFFFSIYVNSSKSLSYMYGSLTSIIILLLWLYFTSIIIMIGGVFNAIISNHKSK